MNRLPPSRRTRCSCAVRYLRCGGRRAARGRHHTDHDDTAGAQPRPDRVGVDALARRVGRRDLVRADRRSRPKGITVSYPENTGSFSSLYKQSTLLAGDTDYSSIKVQVGDDVLGNERIKLNVEYRLAGRRRSRRWTSPLPVVEAAGPTVEQLTTHRRPDRGRFRRMGRCQLQGKQAGRDRRPTDRDTTRRRDA